MLGDLHSREQQIKRTLHQKGRNHQVRGES
jgi:hypothetical protein